MKQPQFDWEAARAMRADGMTYTAIANILGVSPTSIARICDEKTRARMDANARAWQHRGVCIDCGGPRTRNTTLEREGLMKGRCKDCDAIRRATSVRGAELRCTTCRAWKADEEFPSNRAEKIRRERHGQCRVCQTTQKRQWRRRYPEKSRVLEREAKRRQRAKAQ